MSKNDVLNCIEATFSEIYVLKSIIKITREACLEKEVNSSYYNLSQENKKYLSEERNHYINMLTMALDKITKLENISESMERELPMLHQNAHYSC